MALRATEADEKPASARARPFPGPWPPAPGPWPRSSAPRNDAILSGPGFQKLRMAAASSSCTSKTV